MIGQHAIDIERKTITILKLLSDSTQPLGSRILARRLGDLGIDLGERAVRYRLKSMDERGLTRPAGRKDGRAITKLGITELESALVNDRIGLVITKIRKLVYQSSFDPKKYIGTVPINVSLLSREEFSQAIEAMKGTFLTRFSVSDLMTIASGGEKLGEIIVPKSKVGLATVSHILIYAALLRAGIPVDIRFGGIVQIHNNQALRFIDLIDYASCSLDPTEAFIAGNMTSVSKVTKEGNGKILASFCEIPAVARSDAEAVIKELEAVDMRGLVIFGGPGEAVCQLPVSVNNVGMVLTDGLNPVATAVEAGIKVVNHAMNGVIYFSRLERYRS